MAKRTKKILKSIESIKLEIEKHFLKLKNDIKEKNIERGRYHIKEISKSLINALQIRFNILKQSNDISITNYKEKLKKLSKELEFSY